MLIKIALILSVVLQFAATVVAISLIRRTRYNISWILISIGFLLMAARRFYELLDQFTSDSVLQADLLSSWMAVLISLLMFVGVVYIRQIFNIQEKLDNMRKQNEARVLSAIIRTEEKARQDFAKELHDGLGPVLSSVKMAISAIDISAMDPENKDIIQHTEQNIDEAIRTIKEISNNLSPHILKNYGLREAMEAFIQRFNTHESLEIRWNTNLKDERFDSETEIAVYRIFGELISNTLKHASATIAEISLHHEASGLELMYSDNGVGFDMSTLDNKYSGIGLSNINSRVASLDGTLEIETGTNEGFNLKIFLPL